MRRAGGRTEVLVCCVAFALGCRSTSARVPGPAELPSLDADSVLAALPPRASVTLERQRLARRLAAGARLGRAERWALRLRLAWLARVAELGGEASSRVAAILADPAAPPRARAIAQLLRADLARRAGNENAALLGYERALALAGDAGTDRRARAALASLRPAARRPDARERVRAPARAEASFVVLRRADWGSRAPRPERMQPMGRPSRITVHHSAEYAGASEAQAIDQVRNIQRNHIRDKHWGDLGYHFLIDRRGRILEGRELRWQGAHAGNGAANRGNIGVCLLGNFEPGSGERGQRPSAAQIQSLEALLRWLAKRFAIPPERIYTHQEIHPRGPGATLCPGRTLTPIVRAMRARLRS